MISYGLQPLGSVNLLIVLLIFIQKNYFKITFTLLKFKKVDKIIERMLFESQIF